MERNEREEISKNLEEILTMISDDEAVRKTRSKEKEEIQASAVSRGNVVRKEREPGREQRNRDDEDDSKPGTEQANIDKRVTGLSRKNRQEKESVSGRADENLLKSRKRSMRLQKEYPDKTGLLHETAITTDEEDGEDSPPQRFADREERTSHLRQSDREDGHRNKLKRSRRGDFSLLRPNDALIAAFTLPVVIMVVIFAQRGIFPFGEESFLRTDMYHQYAPFFSEFQNKLTQGGSLLYSWDIGMGVNFAALYSYYLASPLNWLLILCPKSLIIEFMTYSIVLKIGLSGLTFAYYLRKHSRTTDFGVAFFGIFYALSGYMAAYSWNIMWLDCILLFPLIVLGLERLVKHNKCGLYCVTLGTAILSNYYISIMICIFMVLYFASLLILEPKTSWKSCGIKIVNFTVYSLLAGGLAAIVLLPEIYALQLTASSKINFPDPDTYTAYFSIFDMLARHMGNVRVEIGLAHWPNIYCGVAIFILFLLYLGSKKISVKEKVVYCGLLLLFFASFSIDVLNFMWHGFHYPNSLPCRQSFIYIFLMLLICYRAYSNLRETPWKHVVIAFWGSIGFIILAQKLVPEDHHHFIVYYVAILFLAIYAGLIYLYKKSKTDGNFLILLTLAVVAIEAAINTTATSVTTTSRTSYVKDNQAVEKLLADFRPDTFYRIEKVTRKTKNDGAWMNFPSVSLFSSTANADLTRFFKELGCEASTNAYSITGSTPLVDSLLAVKYALYTGEAKNKQSLTLINQVDDTYLYENPYTLPVAFVVPDNLEENWKRDLGNPASIQNSFCDIIGADRVLVENYGEAVGDTFYFTPEQSGDYYIYVTSKKVEKVIATIGENTKTYDNINRGYFVDLGYCKAGEEITLRSDDPAGEELKAEAYRFSENGLKSVYEKLNQEPMKIISWTDTAIEGTINLKEDGHLFTSIPYDKGWSVWIDGYERTPRKIMEAFLSVDVPEGTHTVRFEYKPDGLKLGTMISGGSLLIFVILLLAGIQIRKMKQYKIYEENE